MILEACVESFEEAKKAELLGADRIELCSDLSAGGLTPSFDLMQKTCSNLKIPVMVMIRPRANDFVYSEKEISQMKREIDFAKQAGASGVVFGLLTSDGKIDQKNTTKLADYASPLPVTFHKAIDQIADPVSGVETLNKINGITRILTSGGQLMAMEGKETIRQMIKTASDKITIVVAGKVTDKNVVKIQLLTGANEFHGKKIVGEIRK
jgi:copper homeostasis protein